MTILPCQNQIQPKKQARLNSTVLSAGYNSKEESVGDDLKCNIRPENEDKLEVAKLQFELYVN